MTSTLSRPGDLYMYESGSTDGAIDESRTIWLVIESGDLGYELGVNAAGRIIFIRSGSATRLDRWRVLATGDDT